MTAGRTGRRRLTAGALALCAAPAVAGAQPVVGPAAPYAAVARALEPLVARERAQKGIPAISVALVDGRRVVWARGFGWADSAAGVRATAATPYRVGAVSQLFTDLAVLQLAERGALALDAPVRRYLPDFRPHNPFGGEITVRELMAHRAGLTREPPVGSASDSTAPPLAETVASLSGTALVSEPGARAHYSDAGVAVLGAVLERTRREPFAAYVRRTVLEPAGLAGSTFEPTPERRARLARGALRTLDGRRLDAPAFPLGPGPAAGLYSTVLDLGRFVGIVLGGGTTPEGWRVASRATLDALWTPPAAAPGGTTGDNVGFTGGRLDGRRVVGRDGAAPGYATALRALPDDSLGVVVVATLDGANAVTDHIAAAALRLMLDARAGRALTPDALAGDTTAALPPGRALALAGRYAGARSAVDLQEYEGRLFLTPVRGGSRAELRAPAAPPGAPEQLVVDDPLAYGPRVTVLGGGRIALGGDTLRRAATPGAAAVAMAEPKPAAARAEYASLIGEYGPDYNTLYVREKDGQLGAVIDWFYEYPLTRVSPDVYRFPDAGRYAGEAVVFRRGADGRAAVAVAGAVPFARRALPGDDDRINASTPPVRPPAELRREALAATPPVEAGEFRPTDLVELRRLDPTIRYDIRYATSNNFMGTPFYSSAHAFMQRPAAEAVARAAAALRPLGYGLLVHDSYRPWYVTKMFWDGTPPDKHVFVADPAQGSRHNRGAAVDLTLCDLRTGAPVRMTGGYDETTTRSYPLYPGGTSLQRWHRDLLRHAMEAQGFTVYEAEWWHFDYNDWRHYRIGTQTFEQLAARGAER